nr:Proline dehydrogenase domain containing protein [Haemonchus contortus]
MGLRLLAVQPRVLLRVVRSASVAAPKTKVAEKPEPATPELAEEIKRCYSNLDLSFQNTKEAFKSKTNTDIVRALLVLRLCSIDALVKNNHKILGALRAVLGQTLFKKLLKSTFFGHFVAGESREEVEPVVARLKQFGVKSILDYSVESDLSSEEAVKKAKSSQLTAEIAPAAIKSRIDPKTLQGTQKQYAVHEEFADRRKDVVGARTYFYEGEETCDRNRDIFMETIDAVAKVTHGEGFAAIKATALGRPTLLLKLSVCVIVHGSHFDIKNVSVSQATSEMYHACLKRLAEEHVRRGKGSVSVMIASHNEDSTRFAVNLMKDYGIAPSEKIMCFAQLYGMCDQISFSLGQAGYSVYKYLPYGPVDKVLPYLTRRATENSSILKKANKEKELLRSELKRRLSNGEFIHRIPFS